MSTAEHMSDAEAFLRSSLALWSITESTNGIGGTTFGCRITWDRPTRGDEPGAVTSESVEHWDTVRSKAVARAISNAMKNGWRP